MVTLVDLTGNLADLTGGAYTASYAKVWIETNVNGFIVDGFGQQDNAQIVAGAVLVALLALATELLLGLVQRAVVSQGLRTESAGVAEAPAVVTA